MREFKDVLNGYVSDGGHAIELELSYTDGTTEAIKCPQENAPRLAHAIHTLSVLAERARKAQPGQEISIEIPYVANDTTTGASVDGSTVTLRFLTAMGAPAMFAMSPDLA